MVFVSGMQLIPVQARGEPSSERGQPGVGLSNFFANVAARGHASTGRHVVQNAMTPALWLCGIVCPTCFGAAYGFRDQPFFCATFAILGALPIVTACGLYIYFSVRDPDRLHSEDFRLRTRALEITESKGGRLIVDRVNLQEIANPYPSDRALPAAATVPGAVDNKATSGGDS